MIKLANIFSEMRLNDPKPYIVAFLNTHLDEFYNALYDVDEPPSKLEIFSFKKVSGNVAKVLTQPQPEQFRNSFPLIKIYASFNREALKEVQNKLYSRGKSLIDEVNISGEQIYYFFEW